MSAIHIVQIILCSEYIVQNHPVTPRKIWFACISWLCCIAVFSQEKMLLTKKLVWRKRECSLNNAEMVSLGSSRYGEKSKLKYVFTLLYYSTLSPSRDWCNCEPHRVSGLCGLSRWAKLSFHLVQKYQEYFSLVLLWQSSHRYIDGWAENSRKKDSLISSFKPFLWQYLYCLECKDTLYQL